MLQKDKHLTLNLLVEVMLQVGIQMKYMDQMECKDRLKNKDWMH